MADPSGSGSFPRIPQELAPINTLDLVLGEKHLVGSLGGSCEPDTDFPLFVDWYTSAEHRDTPAAGCAVVSFGADAPRSEHRAVYDALYGEYLRLHDLFGRGGDDVMKRLKRLQLAGIERLVEVRGNRELACVELYGFWG